MRTKHNVPLQKTYLASIKINRPMLAIIPFSPFHRDTATTARGKIYRMVLDSFLPLQNSRQATLSFFREEAFAEFAFGAICLGKCGKLLAALVAPAVEAHELAAKLAHV